MSIIDLDQFLGEAAKPFTFISLAGKEWPVYHPDDLSEGAYLKHQAAQGALTKALEDNAPGAFSSAIQGDPNVKTAMKIKKVAAKNQSKVKKFRVYEKVEEGLYWPWEDLGPTKIKVVHDDGKQFTEEEINEARANVEILLNSELQKDLDTVEGKCKRQRLMRDGEEWGYIESSHIVPVEALKSLCEQIALILPAKDERQFNMSEIAFLTAAQYKPKKDWCESLVDDPDFSLEGRPPKMVNFLFDTLQKELGKYNEEKASEKNTDEPTDSQEVVEAPKEPEMAIPATLPM